MPLQREFKVPVAQLLSAAPKTHAMAVADQAVVSGTSFVTTIMVGHWCLPSELGVFALGISLLLSWVVIHDSLILVPYAIYRHRQQNGTAAEYAGSVLVLCILLYALAATVMAVIALSLPAFGAPPELTAVTWILAAIVPFTLLRDFARQFYLTHLRMPNALLLDAGIAALQIAAVSGLAQLGLLSAVTACLAVGAACALAGAAWLYLVRQSFELRVGQPFQTLKQHWKLGMWIGGTQLAWWAKTYFTYVSLALILGTAATGVYAACMTIALFSNPLVLGISRILPPRAALALGEAGGAALRRVTFRDTLFIAGGMAAFCVIVMFAGDFALQILFPAEPYQGNGHIVTLLALGMLASAVRMPAASALTSLEHADWVFWTSAPAALAAVALVYGLTIKWGMLGAAYAFLAGDTAASAALWVALLLIHRRASTEKSATGFIARPADSPAEQITN